MHEHDPEHPHDHAHHAGHDPAHAYHEPAAPGSQPVSGELKDPVCGMTVTPASPHQCEFDRATYFFCSAKCLGKFRLEPARYLSPHSVPAPVAEAGTEYTCPMHPEIRQPGPGNCPKCGMALEPVLPDLEERETLSW